jgi:hypothetical protein
MKELLIKSNTMENESKKWEISETKDGITKRMCVEKVENGFIISKSKYGNINDNYVDETKKYISTKNPLEKEEEKEEIKSPMSREELYSFLDGAVTD